jgi:hypothetical protein
MIRVNEPTVSICELVSQSVATRFSGPAPQQKICAQHGFDVSALAQILKAISIFASMILTRNPHREI